MSKKTTRSIHVPFPVEVYDEIETYTESRGSTKVATVRHAVELMLAVEDKDFKKHHRLEKAIKKYFMIPQGFIVKSFWLTLYMLGINYPDASSRKFWGHMVYIHDEELSHRQVLDRMLQEGKSGERRS